MTHSTTTVLNFVSEILNPILQLPVNKYVYQRDVTFEIDLDWLLDKDMYLRMVEWYKGVAKVDSERTCFDEWNFHCKLRVFLCTDDEGRCDWGLKIVCQHIAYDEHEFGFTWADKPDGCKMLAELLRKLDKQLEKVQTT